MHSDWKCHLRMGLYIGYKLQIMKQFGFKKHKIIMKRELQSTAQVFMSKTISQKLKLCFPDLSIMEVIKSELVQWGVKAGVQSWDSRVKSANERNHCATSGGRNLLTNVNILNTKSLGTPPEPHFKGLWACLTSSFTPFGRSGRVTHATVNSAWEKFKKKS